MSIWKKVSCKALAKNVDLKLLEESLAQMNIGLDKSVKKITGINKTESCYAALVYNNRTIKVGIKLNSDNGVDLVGDLWGTGLSFDGGQEELLGKIAGKYQYNHVTKAVKENNWCILSENVEDNKTILTLERYV